MLCCKMTSRMETPVVDSEHVHSVSFLGLAISCMVRLYVCVCACVRREVR